ncbi:7416_t:CDS:10 [Entrophospora sp. SA101]|nr:7416_t:CDS:10 [Entrophospora sp. SA101]
MPIKEQKKSEIKQVRNRKYKTLIKNQFKKVEVYLKEKKTDEKELKSLISATQQALDKAVHKKVIHKNKAARKKSQLHNNLNKQEIKEIVILHKLFLINEKFTFCLNANYENKPKHYSLPTTPLNCQKLQKIVPDYDFSATISNVSATATKSPSLRDYQLADVKFLSQLKNVAIFSEMRTGKTPTALMTFRQWPVNKLLIIVPSILQQQWQKSDTFKIDSLRFKKLKKRKEVNSLYCVIIDEAHFLRNHQSQQSKSIYTLKDVPYKMALTGTPVSEIRRGGKLYKIWQVKDFKSEQLRRELQGQISQFSVNRRQKEVLAHLKTLTLYPPALSFLGPGKPLAQALAEQKIVTGLIIGKTNYQAREEYIQQFQNGELGILLCNIQSAGMGLNLNRAETIIFADRSYSPADNEQAEARFLPTNNSEPARIRLVIDLICRGTIDEKILKLLKKKEDIIKQNMNDKDQVVIVCPEEILREEFLLPYEYYSRHSYASNVETYLNGVEGHIFFNVLNVFDYQGEKVVSIDYISENPEIDADFLRRDKIVRISFDESQPHRITQGRLGKTLNIVGPCSLQPYASTGDQLLIREFVEIVKKNATTNSSPQSLIADTPQFTIKSAVNSSGIQVLTTEPFTFQGREIRIIRINSTNPDLKKDSQVIIKGVNLATDKAKINGKFLSINTHYSDIEIVVAGNNNSDSSNNNSNSSNPTATIFQNALDNNDRQLLDLINEYEVAEVINNSYDLKKKPNQSNSSGNPNNSNFNHNDSSNQNNNNLPTIRNEAITALTQALNQEPKITDSELSKPNWTGEINNSSDASFINNLREELLAEIEAKRKAKAKNSELDELISQAEQTSIYEKLEELIKKIRACSHLPHYQAKQTQISALETKLGQLDLNKYKKGAIADINNELNNGDNSLKTDELDQENKDYEKQLNQAQTPEQVNQIREKVKNDVGEKKAEKELNNLLAQVKKVTTNSDKLVIKLKLLQFLKEENCFKQKISQKYEKAIKEALSQLENQSTTLANQDKNPNKLVYWLIGAIILKNPLFSDNFLASLE